MSKSLLIDLEKSGKNAQIKKRIVKQYMQSGSLTMTELSKEVDLSIPTVTRFISEMCQEGYVLDYGKLETPEGRYPNLYGLNPTSGYFVGVDIKQSGINVGLMNFRGDMVDQSMSVPYNFENTPTAFGRLCQIIEEFIEKQGVDKATILNIAINISGRVNPDSGYSYSVFYFEERSLAEIFSERLGYKVIIDNDTRAMTYGEYTKGCVTNERDVIFVNVSWGLAVGIVIDGKIYKGKSGFSGEFGHMRVYDNEILCHCGKKGCLETEASGSAMYRKLIEQVNNGASSLLSARILKGEKVTLEDIVSAINKEDVLCIDLVEEVGLRLGEQIAGLINLLNPQMVVIGGVVSLVDEYIMQPIKTAIRKYSLNLVSKDSVVIVSKLKDQAGVIGACMVARSRVFDN